MGEMLLECTWIDSDTAYKDSRPPLLRVGLAGCKGVMATLLDSIGINSDTVIRMG